MLNKTITAALVVGSVAIASISGASASTLFKQHVTITDGFGDRISKTRFAKTDGFGRVAGFRITKTDAFGDRISKSKVVKTNGFGKEVILTKVVRHHV